MVFPFGYILLQEDICYLNIRSAENIIYNLYLVIYTRGLFRPRGVFF
jgi:hypothetical protein